MQANGDSSKIITTAVAGEYDLYAIYEDGAGRDLAACDDALTVYEAIILVSKLNAQIKGVKDALTGTDFASCLEYAQDNGLLPSGGFDKYGRAILRSEIAEMIYAAIPAYAREEINNIADISDINDYDEFKDAVLALYRAGIFSGTDDEHTFNSIKSF